MLLPECADAGRATAAAAAGRPVVPADSGLVLDELARATKSIFTRGLMLTFFLCSFCLNNIGRAGTAYEETSTGLLFAASASALLIG